MIALLPRCYAPVRFIPLAALCVMAACAPGVDAVAGQQGNMTLEALLEEDSAASRPLDEPNRPDPSFRGSTAPSFKILDELEASIVMPRDAYPLATYDREYTFNTLGSRIIVEGGFKAIKRGANSGVRRSVPLSRFEGNPADGGCGFVDVYYDPAQKKFIHVSCGGLS
ncbi:hypothetical protein [Sphingomonas profundi]|uniref:hypothetical protein n=1 Tax=Alterirhizorhabdus profundi TaxID=2681549 RepID=UPI0012E76723|nr:hypothetical protein [Sphingomonas profundi]